MKNYKMPGFMKAIQATSMRHMNRSMILELVRQEGPMARSEISQALELSMPTVMRIVDELIAEGLVQAIGDQKGETGHPREMLEINKNGYAVIGVDLGGTKLYGALANIGGEVLDEVYQAQAFFKDGILISFPGMLASLLHLLAGLFIHGFQLVRRRQPLASRSWRAAS